MLVFPGVLAENKADAADAKAEQQTVHNKKDKNGIRRLRVCQTQDAPVRE